MSFLHQSETVFIQVMKSTIILWKAFLPGAIHVESGRDGDGRMGYSKSDKAETHTRIVSVAAKRFRELGLEGIGVADVMKELHLESSPSWRTACMG